MHVLLVEDERTLALIIKDTLETQDFHVTTAHNGEEGLRMFFAAKPDIVVADVMMPHMDGFEMVRRLRAKDAVTPILFLTARTDTQDVVHGFELGANDYLRKPFGMQELIIRLKALLGRIRTASPATSADEKRTAYVIGNYQLDTVREQLIYATDSGLPIVTPLSHRESEILRLLCQQTGNVVPIQDILLQLWGDDSYFNTRSLHVFITKLRHKLSADTSIRIINVRGVGYKLVGGMTTT